MKFCSRSNCKKKKFIVFVGVILELKSVPEESYKIQFLRKRPTKNEFYFPVINDITWNPKTTLRQKLTEKTPAALGYDVTPI